MTGDTSFDEGSSFDDFLAESLEGIIFSGGAILLPGRDFFLAQGTSSSGSRPSYDFGSAHYDFDVSRNLPDAVNEELRLVFGSSLQSLQRYGVVAEEYVQAFPSPEGVAEQMLKKETSLDLDRGTVYAYPTSTRELIKCFLNRQVEETGKKVLMPIPNWYFWDFTAYEPAYLLAANEEQLVDGFERRARHGDLSTLLLVNPANPLLYTLSEDGAKAIDAVAQKYGVDIVIDDVLRGTLPIDDRDTIGRWFSEPIIIEGMNKRFGDFPLGPFTYIYLPDGKPRLLSEKLSPVSEFEYMFRALVLQNSLEHASESAVGELSKRNVLFDVAMLSSLEGDDVTITRPYHSNLTSLITLPDGIGAEGVAYSLVNSDNIITANLSFYMPDGYKLPAELQNKLRITVGRHSDRELIEGASALAQGIRRECRL